MAMSWNQQIFVDFNNVTSGRRHCVLHLKLAQQGQAIRLHISHSPHTHTETHDAAFILYAPTTTKATAPLTLSPIISSAQCTYVCMKVFTFY